MGIPIDTIYELSERDQASPLWGFVYKSTTAGAIATEVSTDAETFRAILPRKYMLNVTQVSVRAVPGPGISCLGLRIEIDRPPLASSIHVLEDPFQVRNPPAALINEVVIITGKVDLIFQGDEIAMVAVATFSGAIAPNAVSLGWCGYYMPQGNLAKF